MAPNALETLVRLLARLKSKSGEIRIPKLYKAVEPPTKEELKTWKRLPFDEEAYLREEVTGKALTGLKEYSVFERVWALPDVRDSRHPGADSSAKVPRRSFPRRPSPR